MGKICPLGSHYHKMCLPFIHFSASQPFLRCGGGPGSAERWREYGREAPLYSSEMPTQKGEIGISEEVGFEGKEYPSSLPLFPSSPNTPVLSIQEIKELAFPENSLGPQGHPEALGFQVASMVLPGLS